MCGVPRGGMLATVPSDQARLTIVLDLQADPIAGVVRDEDGHDEPSAGWMGPTRAIERRPEAAWQAYRDPPA